MSAGVVPLSSLRISVVGLGLMGGSLARALKATDDPPWIGAASLEPEELARARDEGVLDRTFRDAREAAASGDVVVYAASLDATLEMLGAHADAWADDAVLTDVVSVKGPLLARIRDVGGARRFVGGHPMAGSERSGFGASRGDLFRGARVHLVRGDADEDAVRVVEALWRSVGARPAPVEAEVHDRAMAWLSHLPQLLSSALSSLLARRGHAPDELGPGGGDMTRLAGSSPELWEGLLAALAEEDARVLSEAGRELQRLASLLEGGDREAVRLYLEGARRWRGGRDAGEAEPWS